MPRFALSREAEAAPLSGFTRAGSGVFDLEKIWTSRSFAGHVGNGRTNTARSTLLKSFKPT